MIIGIAGLARSGKDTAAVHIAAREGLYGCAFADGVKRTAMEMFNLSEEQVFGLNGYDREKKVGPWDISVREILQKVGTECGRNVFRLDFWPIRLGQRLQEKQEDRATPMYNYLKNFIVSDVRFPNEVDWITAKGGRVIEIARPETSDLTVGIEGHASEVGGLSVNATVSNNGSIIQLNHALDECVDDLFATGEEVVSYVATDYPEV